MGSLGQTFDFSGVTLRDDLDDLDDQTAAPTNDFDDDFGAEPEAEAATTVQSLVESLKVRFANELPEEAVVPDELIEGLLVKGTATLLYGDSNSGKTFYALALAASVAEGKAAFGRQVEQSGVLYLASESPASITLRLQAIKKHHGYKLDRLAIVKKPLRFGSTDADADNIIALATEQRERLGSVGLIVADTLSRMADGCEENSSTAMTGVMTRFERVAEETGAAVLIIHHNGKDSTKGARGSGAIRAVVSTEVVIEADANGERTVTVTKQRELASKGKTTGFKLDVLIMGKSKFGQEATTCVAVDDPDFAARSAEREVRSIDRHRQTFERVWAESGYTLQKEAPYVDRVTLKNDLLARGINNKTVEQQLKTSVRGIVGVLIAGDYIRKCGSGWIVVDVGAAAALLISRPANYRQVPEIIQESSENLPDSAEAANYRQVPEIIQESSEKHPLDIAKKKKAGAAAAPAVPRISIPKRTPGAKPRTTAKSPKLKGKRAKK